MPSTSSGDRKICSVTDPPEPASSLDEFGY